MSSTKPIEAKRELLTEEQVAKLAGVEISTIQRWSRNRTIPGAKKLGRKWRYNPDKIEHWLGFSPGAMPVPVIN